MIILKAFEAVRDERGLRNTVKYEEGILRINVIRKVVLLRDLIIRQIQIMSCCKKLV